MNAAILDRSIAADGETGAGTVHEGPVTLLVGSGKSGSKRVLRILDASGWTHCRCEPNAMRGSPFDALPDREVESDDPEPMGRLWDGVIGWAGSSMGERDWLPRASKRHVRTFARFAGIERAIHSRRARRLLSVVHPAWGERQWTVPRILARPEALSIATLVVKTGPAPAWAGWVLGRRERTRVVHVVRHPGGFLHSYRVRWLGENGREESAVANRARLRRIVEQTPGWAHVFGEISRMSAEESELWFWRYAAETTHRAGESSPAYHLIKDDDVVRDPMAAARSLYEMLGLPWERSVEAYVEARASDWQSCETPWRKLLDRSCVEIVERVLEGSPLRAWWADDQAVSTPEYSIL